MKKREIHRINKILKIERKVQIMLVMVQNIET